jgi:hypothetical protein
MHAKQKQDENGKRETIKSEFHTQSRKTYLKVGEN